jgi:prepilin-type N-terminal cleavage/methylation domain-containing protein
MRGYTLIECLCGLSLLGLISAVTIRFTQHTSAIVSNTTAQIDSRLSITKTALTISAALSTLERSHLPGLVSLSNGSWPRTPYGGEHPVLGVGPTSRPRPESDIISFVEIDPRYRGRIHQSSFSGESIEVTTCGSPLIPAPDQFRSHLVVGLSGSCQITGTPQPTSAGCFTLSGHQTQGLLHSRTGCPSSSLLEYAPIVREFSLFIDRTGELRLVSHTGMRILENQPMTRGLRSLRLLPSLTPAGVQFFSVQITASNTPTHTFTVFGALTQGSLWNEILL